MDAPRPPLCDAERHGMHSHAERGNDQFSAAEVNLNNTLIGLHLFQ
ncbi:hypothetical protein HNR03_004233 [Pseudomonas sp. JAI111]|nr:hypothetical protein [Pseudomonas sp. JAI111]